MTDTRKTDPLHGVTLEAIVTKLQEHYGWEELGRAIPARCFNFDPSIKSSLTFLRKTQWARTKVEKLYVATFHPPPPRRPPVPAAATEEVQQECSNE